jgi:NAD(P)-dependent dehydrogenase (short-subunit alcohol dehydrogenase family)
VSGFAPELLAGSTILVTGGGTGLGRAMAERFGELGASVAVIGRRTGPLEDTVAAITARGGSAAWASVDVRDPQAVEACIDDLEGRLGQFDGLVNNAAGNFLAPTEDLSPNAFDAVVKIVLHGTFHCTTALGRRWIQRGTKGSILSIVTTYAWMGSAFVVPSAAANAIAPGPIPTEGAFSRLLPENMLEAAIKAVPLGRFGEPAELADLATFLMSPLAGWITGECVVLDGGEWLRNGQEFSKFTDIPRDRFKAMMQAMKPGKG